MSDEELEQPAPPETGLQVAGEHAYTVGGHTFQGQRVQQCYVCTHPQRDSIEYMLAVSAATYQSIIDCHIVVPDRPLSRRGIYNHIQRGHMNHVLAAKRILIEQYAAEHGLNLEEGVHSLVTGAALAQEVMQKTFTLVAEGAILPSIQDGLRAGEALEKFSKEASDAMDAERTRAVFDRYFDISRQVMTHEQFTTFCTMLSSDPDLMSLIAGNATRTKVVDTVAVDEDHQLELESGSFD